VEGLGLGGGFACEEKGWEEGLGEGFRWWEVMGRGELQSTKNHPMEDVPVHETWNRNRGTPRFSKTDGLLLSLRGEGADGR